MRGKILVLVQLAGGNDGLNTVIPIADPEYGKLRPAIGIASGAALTIDDEHALHPAMAGMKECSTRARSASSRASATQTRTARISARWTSGILRVSVVNSRAMVGSGVRSISA